MDKWKEAFEELKKALTEIREYACAFSPRHFPCRETITERIDWAFSRKEVRRVTTGLGRKHFRYLGVPLCQRRRQTEEERQRILTSYWPHVECAICLRIREGYLERDGKGSRRIRVDPKAMEGDMFPT